MRIIAGQWRGRTLQAPPGLATRPTSDRARQALFDMLRHAPWSAGLEGARVVDVFAGTGALGLEALSRGAANAVFIEQDRAALTVLRANIAACGAEALSQVIATDATRPPAGVACDFVMLDPPYGQDLVPRSLVALQTQGWIAPHTIVVAEIGREEHLAMSGEVLVARTHGAAQWVISRGLGEIKPNLLSGETQSGGGA